MHPLIEFFGRLHPMMLHAPIGLLIGLVGVEAVAMARRSQVPKGFRSTLAWLAAASAAASAGTGYILHLEGGFDPQTVDLHEWLGIGVAAACVLAAVLQQAGCVRLFRGVLVLAAVAIVPAGHLGASMTHGAGYLTAPFRQERTGAGPVESAGGANANSVYAATIAPIFQKNCISCHGTTRQKGGLALHTPEAITAGSDTGAVIVARDPGTSEMVRRLKLPLDDDDHMPPKGKPQPTAAQIKAIEDWIASGASFAGGEAPANGAPEATADDAPKPPPGPTPADPAAIKALQDRLVHVEPIAQDSPLLAVDFSAVAPTMSEDEVRTLLGPLRQQVADLSLARTKTGDSLVELVSLMPNLTRLNATGTGLTDAGLALLSTHAKLEDLVLSRTHLTDAAATALAAMPSLKRVYVWDAGLSAEALATLRAKGLTVDAGDAAPAEAVEAESELKLTNDAPALGQGGGTGGASDALKPVNSMCPVSGKPVDPNYVIVFKGRAIGFCCPNCPHDFWTDPAKFEDKIKP